jgi:CPA2 family monovalent cation:H+ antiporter-2
MSLAQIGEFSFIIAALGITTGATDRLLYSVAVAVSAMTTLLTPWLIRAAAPTANFIDRKLPRSLQTFVALYGTWLEGLAKSSGDEHRGRIGRLCRWLAVDAVVVAVVIIGASIELERIAAFFQQEFQVPERLSALAVVAAAAAVSSPFWIGMLRVAKFLGLELAQRAFPSVDGKSVDLAAAPRRLLVVTVQLAVVVLVGFPLVAITQPFLPPFRGAVVLAGVLLLSALSFWRKAGNFQGHAVAAAMAIAESLGRQTREGRADAKTPPLDEVNQLITGLGSPVSLRLEERSPAVGKTLAELNLRGLTGATVLAIRRGDDAVLVPSGHERLVVGDVLAVAGTRDAVEAAERLLAATVDPIVDDQAVDRT